MGTIATSIISLLRGGSQGLEMLRSQTDSDLQTPEYLLLIAKLFCLPIVQANVSVQNFASLLISSGSHSHRIKKIFFSHISKNVFRSTFQR